MCLLAAVGGGCSDSGNDRTEYHLVAGLRIPSSADIRSWDAVEEWRVNEVGGEPLEFIRHVEPHPTGNAVYVLDSGPDDLLVLQSTSRERISLPSSSRPYVGFVWDGEGHLWVRRADAYIVLDEDGTVIREAPMPYNPLAYPFIARWDQQGRLTEFRSTTERVGSDSIRYVVLPVRHSSDFDTMEELPPLESLLHGIPGSSAWGPYGDKVVFGLGPGQTISFGTAMAYRLSTRTLAGDTFSSITVPFEPRPLTPDRRQLLAETWLPDRTIPLSHVSDHEQVLVRIAPSTNGRVLVFASLDGMGRGSFADVFDTSDDRFLGRIHLPVILELTHHQPVLQGAILYGVTSQAGRPAVVALRIRDWPQR